MFELPKLPKSLFARKNAPLLTGIMRGVEREALRTTPDGELSQTPHPAGLGSALTHPQITTDFSEALLEFITPPTHAVDDLFYHLDTIHKFTLSQLQDELLWTHSMPCVLAGDAYIPVARYGDSNNGRMKTVYRVGLGHRYGRSMQTVAGVHYNFSLPNAFWAYLSHEQNSIDDLPQFKDKGYFSLIRNFRRHFWLLIYLFGASPALCASFINGKSHSLHTLEGGRTLYGPYATSLRMGDLGYQSNAQEALYVCYNEKASYIKTLCRAITQEHPAYAQIGVRDDNGNYRQLSTSLLQIENEFYSAIRPKRTARPGETALFALQNRGVEYIEVRCLDINPFTPLGITAEQVYFLDTFLLYCALQDNTWCSPEESKIILRNQKKVVNLGRQPQLELEFIDGSPMPLAAWGRDLLESLRPVAELLDHANGGEHHQSALQKQLDKINDATLTPSAQLLTKLSSDNQGFLSLGLGMAREHHATLSETALNDEVIARMHDMTEESFAEQTAIESASIQPFDSFLHDYYQQYASCNACR